MWKDAKIRHVPRAVEQKKSWIIIGRLCCNFCSNLFGITCWTTTRRTRHWWKVSLNFTMLQSLLALKSFVQYAVGNRILTVTGFFCLAGPLNNLKESMIQFSKPRKLVNRTNPVRQLLHLPSVELFYYMTEKYISSWLAKSRLIYR